MKLVLASNNAKKLAELRTILSGAGVALLSAREAGFTDEIDETGTSFAENACIKAQTVCRATGLPAVGGRFRPVRRRARRRAGRLFRPLYRKP